MSHFSDENAVVFWFIAVGEYGDFMRVEISIVQLRFAL
jgi:hypothetical protein